MPVSYPGKIKYMVFREWSLFFQLKKKCPFPLGLVWNGALPRPSSAEVPGQRLFYLFHPHLVLCSFCKRWIKLWVTSAGPTLTENKKEPYFLGKKDSHFPTDLGQRWYVLLLHVARGCCGRTPSAAGCSGPTCSTPERQTLWDPNNSVTRRGFGQRFLSCGSLVGLLVAPWLWVGGPRQVSMEGIDCPFNSQIFFVRNRR